jgi:hypothetical protein
MAIITSFFKGETYGLQGPAEQAISLLNRLDTDGGLPIPGLLYVDADGIVRQNFPKV